MGETVTPEAFREACARLAAAVSVATLRDEEGRPHGMTISTFTPVSLEPPLVLISIDNQCTLLDRFLCSEWFAVSLLDESQQAIAVAFAEKPQGRFDGIAWSAGLLGQPLIDGAVAAFECRRVDQRRAGDHTILFGEVAGVEAGDGRPLIYSARGYRKIEP